MSRLATDEEAILAGVACTWPVVKASANLGRCLGSAAPRRPWWLSVSMGAGALARAPADLQLAPARPFNPLELPAIVFK